MNQPTRASDPTELGWDDVFRFQRVRLVTAGAAWLSAYSVCAMIPILAAAVVAPALLLVFRQGRQLWRSAWADEV